MNTIAGLLIFLGILMLLGILYWGAVYTPKKA